MSIAEQHTFAIRPDVTFSVLSAGHGHPVVFLHDEWGLSWNPFLSRLAEQFRVFAPQLPGTGESTGLEHIPDLWNLVLCYLDLFDALELESATVIGHSLGGMIAAELAVTDPSRVNRLVLLAPFGLYRDDCRIPDMFAMLPQEIERRLIFDSESALAQQRLQKPTSVEEQVEQAIRRIQAQQAAAKFLWPIPDHGLRTRIHRIQCPTLILWGANDRLIDPVYGADFQRLIRRSQLQVIHNASHLLHLEQTDTVVDAIRRFVLEAETST
ncbi:MAG: alpha/beta hydrolase [Alicyclobacillaceae bacterium]|nr:alpha/beta hydrolase [Alicyclobacillaceae bacterium]